MLRALVISFLLVFLIVIAVSSRLPCVHGVWENDRCLCKDDYTGERCGRRMHCSTFMRNSNGTCISCQKWWTGPHCDAILCYPEYGTATADLLMCECTEPATGENCEIFTSADILSHYNRRLAEYWGPIGALAIIPMLACFLLCERFAKRRQIKRIERTLGDKMIITDDGSEVIHDLYPY